MAPTDRTPGRSNAVPGWRLRAAQNVERGGRRRGRHVFEADRAGIAIGRKQDDLVPPVQFGGAGLVTPGCGGEMGMAEW